MTCLKKDYWDIVCVNIEFDSSVYELNVNQLFIRNIISAKYWPVQKYLGTIQYSLIEAQKREMEEADTVSALASLSMVAGKRR